MEIKITLDVNDPKIVHTELIRVLNKEIDIDESNISREDYATSIKYLVFKAILENNYTIDEQSN